MENPTISKFGKPSISMGHGLTMAMSAITRGYNWGGHHDPHGWKIRPPPPPAGPKSPGPPALGHLRPGALDGAACVEALLVQRVQGLAKWHLEPIEIDGLPNLTMGGFSMATGYRGFPYIFPSSNSVKGRFHEGKRKMSHMIDDRHRAWGDFCGFLWIFGV